MLGVTIRFDTYHNADDNLVGLICSRSCLDVCAGYGCPAMLGAAQAGVHRRFRPTSMFAVWVRFMCFVRVFSSFF